MKSANLVALSALLVAVNDGSAAIRESAVRSLATYHEETAFNALVIARWDQDYRVSKTAILSLGTFGERAIEPLQEALVDVTLPDRATVQALEKIGGPVVTILLEALHHKRLPARRAAANALTRLLKSGILNSQQTSLIMEQNETVAAYVDANLVDVFNNG